MRFPQTFIDDLRRQADIVRVIQDYVSLKKKGANWMACCPFHQEKTPSFSVNPAKDIFYCFGCAKGGSVFNFVMEIERVTFPEAVKIVAEKANMPLPAMVEDQKFETRRKEADEVIELNSWALEWWESQLEQNNAEARAARDYLEGRGISDETCKAFRMGYALDSWDALSAHLKQRGATLQQIERSGLVVKKDAGGFYDRFRGRLIFPVLDAQGRAVAFGGRTLQPDGEPKYLNSPETAAYTKGRHLFGLNITRDEIRRRKFAILVEGYLDLIIPYQFGVRNMAASLGTALTPEQAKLLGRFARKVVVNYDGDSAGVKAAKRAIETLLAEDIETKVLVLPDGSDPDEFIRTHGVEAYHERRGKALPHIQFVLDQAVRDRNLLRPADKAAAVEEALPFVRAVRNGIQKREYFDMAMDALRVEEPALRRELWQTVKANAPAGQDVRQKIVRAAGAQPTVAEQRLLELLVHDAELRRTILPRMEARDYEELPTASIFRALIEIEAEGASVDFTTLGAKIEDDPLAADFVPLLLMGESQRAEGEAVDDTLATAESCLNALHLMMVDRRINELSVEISTAERMGDTERRDRLALEHLEWARRRNALGNLRP
ncbi:MAG TPA: DNA primase [Pyrinomonadaceae bacterium]|jgi:DNA primase|nr:DNA primase [Pyrinomonadaceae bacterium]